MTDVSRLLDWDGGLSLLPPVVAIVLAWMSRRVVPSLAAAAVVGALVVARGSPVDAASALVRVLIEVVGSVDNGLITAFSVLVAATVGVMGRSGGTRALVARVERLASSRRRTMAASWLAGAVVFFDDYANCLVVGSSMSPLCDRYGVSRAKLAYIVDATAAPVASLALVSTWVGYEVGLIAKELDAAGSGLAAFSLFVEALPYRSYCLMTLAFVGAVAMTGRDFGPMAAEEAKAHVAGGPPPHEGPPPALVLGLLPLLTLVFGVFGALLGHGLLNLGPSAFEQPFFTILDAANPFLDMAAGAALAFVVAVAVAVGLGRVPVSDTARAAAGSVRTVMQALAVLYLAWTLGSLIKESGAAAFVGGLLQGRLPPEALPAITFALAGGTAFATGSSYFTMGALLPLVMPLALAVDPAGGPILLASMAAVLDGAVLGDHVSPISDTTILSSIGSGSDLMTHVRTQMPYALCAAAVALVVCTVPASFGVSPWLTLPVGAAACFGIVRGVGRLTGPAAAAP